MAMQEFVVVQILSCIWLFMTPWTAASLASLSLTISRSLPKFMSSALVMPVQPSHSLSLPSPSAFNLSHEKIFHKWKRDWERDLLDPKEVWLQNNEGLTLQGNHMHQLYKEVYTPVETTRIRRSFSSWCAFIQSCGNRHNEGRGPRNLRVRSPRLTHLTPHLCWCGITCDREDHILSLIKTSCRGNELTLTLVGWKRGCVWFRGIQLVQFSIFWSWFKRYLLLEWVVSCC